MDKALGVTVGIGMTSGRGNYLKVSDEPEVVKLRGKKYYFKEVQFDYWLFS